MATPAKPCLVWDNRFGDAVPLASSTASGNVLNLADFRPYTSWKPSALPATVTVNCGSAKSADSLAIFNHDLFTGGCTVEVRGSTDNFAASDVLVHSYTPGSNSPFVRSFTSASYQYWRLRITGTTAPTLTIAVIGVILEFPKGLPRGFAPLGGDVIGQTNVSEEGLPLGKSIVFEKWSQPLAFHNLDASWVRSTFLPIWHAHLKKNPFLFAFDLVNNPAEIYLVGSGDKLPVPHDVSKDYLSISFTVSGVALS